MKVDSVARKAFVILFVIVVFTISVLFLEKSTEGKDGHVEKEKLRAIQTALANLQNELHSVKNDLLDKEKYQAELKTTNQNVVSNHSRVVVPRGDKPLPEKMVKNIQPIRTLTKRAIIFTMDSIGSYEENSLAGGAAGISMSTSPDFCLQRSEGSSRVFQGNLPYESLFNLHWIILEYM